MKDENKTKAQLIEELAELRQRVGEQQPSEEGTSENALSENSGHYLKEELYRLLNEDPSIFDFIQDGSLDGLWYWDIEHPEHEWMSSRFWEVFGYNPEEKPHLAAAWQDMIHPDDLKVALDNFQRHCEDPKYPYDQIVRYLHKNGSTVWVRCRGIAIRDRQGSPVRMLGAHTDITVQKQAEEALQEAHDALEKRVEERASELQHTQEQLAGILATAHAAIISINTDGQVTHFNQGAVRVFGYETQDVLGQPLDVLLPEEFRDTHHRYVEGFSSSPQQARQMGERQEISGRRKNGELFPAEASISKTSIGTETVLTVILRDITETRQAEEEIRESEEMFRQITENISEIFYVTSVEKNEVTYISPVFETIVGLPCEALYESIDNFMNLIHPDDRDRVLQSVFTKQITGDYDEEYRIILPDGRIRWLHDRAFPVEDSQGVVYRIAGVAADITDRKELEKQLRQSQKMQAVGELTAGIAHNFNNKLMVILNGIEMTMSRVQGDSWALQAAKKSTMQAAEMVEQLMMFSRSEGVAEPKPIHVQTILSDAMEIGRKTFDRRIFLIDEIPGDLPLISGDAIQLEQVFLNLLLNARDAVEDNSVSSPSIRMETNVVPSEEGDLPASLASRQRDYIRVNVVDNGVGMNEETQQRVFEPFFTTKEVNEGTGLGMATVYAIVKSHQGWIACESQVGVGTTFSVYLPIVEDEIVAPVVEPPTTMPRGTETILLIEDEEDLRDQLIAVFEQHGYEVLGGKDGQEGWDMFEREWEHVDVVLLDLSMPNRSGQEVLLQMLTLNPDVKVIVSTGYTRHSAESLGAKVLLKKPYRLSQALQTIREVLDE